MSKPIASAVTGLLLISLIGLVLSGCVPDASREGEVEIQIANALDATESDPAIIHLPDVVDRDWDTVTIVCRGVTESELDSTLGGVLGELVDYESPGFTALIAFTEDRAVTHFENLGQSVYFTPRFTPCPLEPDLPSHILILDRSSATLTFVFDVPGDRWIIPRDEFVALADQ